jgi:hypothetical protein
MPRKRVQWWVTDTKQSLTQLLRRDGAGRLTSENLATAMGNAQTTRAVYRIVPAARRQDPENGYDTSLKLLQSLHRHDGPFSVELWSDEDSIKLYISIEATISRTLQQRLDVFFPDATITEIEPVFPHVSADEYVAGARLALRNDYCLQIANPLGASGLRTDPYNEVMSAMTGTGGARAVVQIIFRPAPEEWWRRWYLPLAAGESLRSEPPLLPRQVTCADLVDGSELPTMDERTRDTVRGQQTESAFLTEIRVCGIGASKRTAEQVVKAVGSVFEERYDDPKMDQGLVEIGVPTRQLQEWIDGLVERRLEEYRPRLGRYQYEPCLLTVPELAAVAHVPSRKELDEFALTSPEFEWTDER